MSSRLNKGPALQGGDLMGFTLIEILVVIGIIAILASVVLIAINPARQFKQAHDSQRLANVNAILNAIGQNIADNKGIFSCAAGSIPNATTTMKVGGYDIGPCLVPIYMPTLPFDASLAGSHFNSVTDYNTSYEVRQDPATGRVTVTAASEVATGTGGYLISVTR